MNKEKMYAEKKKYVEETDLPGGTGRARTP